MTPMNSKRARAAISAYADGVEALLDRLIAELVEAGLPTSQAQAVALELVRWDRPDSIERVEALLLGAENKETST